MVEIFRLKLEVLWLPPLGGRSAKLRARKVMTQDIRGRRAGLKAGERAGLAEPDAMAETASFEHESRGRPSDREQRAAKPPRAERTRDGVPERLSPHAHAGGADDIDEACAAGRIAGRDVDTVE